MKLRSKLLLSATCLLTISVAATATSAYAWFTANRQAFVSVTGMSVKSDVDNKSANNVTYHHYPHRYSPSYPPKTALLTACGKRFKSRWISLKNSLTIEIFHC